MNHFDFHFKSHYDYRIYTTCLRFRLTVRNNLEEPPTSMTVLRLFKQRIQVSEADHLCVAGLAKSRHHPICRGEVVVERVRGRGHEACHARSLGRLEFQGSKRCGPCGGNQCRA